MKIIRAEPDDGAYYFFAEAMESLMEKLPNPWRDQILKNLTELSGDLWLEEGWHRDPAKYLTREEKRYFTMCHINKIHASTCQDWIEKLNPSEECLWFTNSHNPLGWLSKYIKILWRQHEWYEVSNQEREWIKEHRNEKNPARQPVV